jgi:hypothetical protein
MGPSQFIDPLLREKELSEEEFLLRKEFVRWFMETRNAYEACIKLGFLEAYAVDWAKAFMAEGYVRRLISEAEREEDTEEASLERQRRYRALMEKEATYYGPGSSHGSRVSAIAHLMKMEGMEAPVKTETEFTYKGGVMMVPALTNPDEWGNLAAKSQAQLKETVKD